jgi:DNA-binding MarR family transcriptional regulator
VEGTLVTNLSHELVKAGHLRTSVSRADSRARLLKLTASGQQLVGRLEPELAEHLGALEAGLPSADLDSYFQTLRSLIDHSTPLPPGLVD